MVHFYKVQLEAAVVKLDGSSVVLFIGSVLVSFQNDSLLSSCAPKMYTEMMLTEPSSDFDSENGTHCLAFCMYLNVDLRVSPTFEPLSYQCHQKAFEYFCNIYCQIFETGNHWK